MVTIYVENRPYEVKEGQNLLKAALSLGFDLPYFCWHPALHSVGACRQCAVKQFKDESDKKGMIIMACMTPVAEGLRISIEDHEAKEFRAAVIGWLMTNHPHDCPICDEGGECHLQDMTVMTGHVYRKHRFRKRTFRNQDLGPFINHEMNRCIQCYRCARFYRDHAGGGDLNAFASRNRTYFGRSRDGALESPFSGNLVEVCPTGVFNDKTLKAHYTRKWDLQTAPSVCMHCGLGCNVIAGERYGTLRRILNRYHGEVNGYFLCDRGRFGYEYVNSPRRIREPIMRGGGSGEATPLTIKAAVVHVAALIRESRRAIGIGSPRASLEANYALRTLVGGDHFFIGVGREEASRISLILKILQEGRARTPSLHDVERADAVLVLGEDLTNTAPLLDLKLRQAVLNGPRRKAEALKIPDWNDAFVRLVAGDDRGPLFIATPARTPLDGIAAGIFRGAPEDIARFGFAVAQRIDAKAPRAAELPKSLSGLARTVADALKDAERPLVIAGLGAGSEAVLKAAANVARALCGKNPKAMLGFTVLECNAMGSGLLSAGDLDGAFEAVSDGGADLAIILENDLYRRAHADRVSAMLEKAECTVALDHLENEVTRRAQVVLPAASFAECSGTMVNQEGRAQRYLQVFVPQGAIQASWKWLWEIRDRVSRTGTLAWEGHEDVARSLADQFPIFDPIQNLLPTVEPGSIGSKVPRQSLRYSGRTAMGAHIDVNEPRPEEDPESPLAYSMEGTLNPPPAPLISRYWAPGWSSVQSLGKFQEEVGGPLRGGETGRRLIEPVLGEGMPYFEEVPEAFRPQEGAWLVVPLFHVFGSEPLSLETPGVAERAPHPYVLLHPEDAEGLEAVEGDLLEIEIEEGSIRLPLKLDDGMARECIGVPGGLPGLPMVIGRFFAKVARVP